MHVAMFSPWQARCGIADYSAQLVQALRALDDTRVSLVPFDGRPHRRADYVAWGRSLNDGDVVHLQHEYAIFGYRLPWRNRYRAFADAVRKPLVITRHVSFDGVLHEPPGGPRALVRQVKWGLYRRWLGPYATHLNRGTFERARHVIVLSRHLKDQLVARGLCADRISVIPPGVPAVSGAAGGAALRAAWGWAGKRVIGQFGFVTPAKGHAIALDALARLPADFVLLVAGGPRRDGDRFALEALHRRAAALGVATRVRVTGYLEAAAVAPHLDACDVLVLPNTHADHSYSALVAAAHQVAPLVLSDVPAHRELAAMSAAFTLFPSGDGAALARVVREIADDERRRAQLMERIRAFARAHTWDRVARQTRDVYASVLA